MRPRKALRPLLAFVAALLVSTVAQAQLFRAYVSSTGNDANPCTLPQPCRLLPSALAAVTPGGEVWMLDSANYNTGTVSITQSVSILAVPGAVGSLVTSGGPAISIMTASLAVSLRNVAISPFPGTTAYGIELRAASLLTIDNSVIANVGGGVIVNGAGAKLKMSNSAIKGVGGYAVWVVNGGSAEISGTQMLVSSGAGSAAVEVNSTTASASTTVTVSDSIISGFANGVFATASASGATSKVLLTRSTIEDCSFTGMNSQASAGGSTNISISGNMVTNNATAWFIGSGASAITTLGNNHITDNAGASTGSLSPGGLQ